jgi:deoxyribodipyrimidine photo-lyase
MTVGLLWFKNDLRLYDNESLHYAVQQCDQIICFYSVEPYLFETLNLGFKKTDINRFKFLEQALKNLQNNLENIGGHLIISSKSAVVEIPLLVRQHKVSIIFAEEEYAFEELQIKANIIEQLPNIKFNFYWGKTLYHIDDIPFSIAKIPLTSKAYRIPVSNQSQPRSTFKAPLQITSPTDAISTKFPSYSSYGFTSEEYQRHQPYLDGGEDEALKRLQYYTIESQLLTGYRWTRNKSLGLDYSSKLSPYLALGCISPRTIYEAVKEYEITIKKNQSTWWLIFELVWRDYFTFKGMRFGNAIFRTTGISNKEKPFENDLEKFKRWQNGTTGIPFIDAHMRQLNETGYMSNRGRVNCASYFIHDLKIDWTWGAAYFESKLIDYDVSANWMNWHMQAFEIYYTNPVHQSLKYQSNEFIATWVAELKSIKDNSIHAPWFFPELNTSTTYPKPIEIYPKWLRAVNRILATVNSSNKLF